MITSELKHDVFAKQGEGHFILANKLNEWIFIQKDYSALYVLYCYTTSRNKYIDCLTMSIPISMGYWK